MEEANAYIRTPCCIKYCVSGVCAVRRRGPVCEQNPTGRAAIVAYSPGATYSAREYTSNGIDRARASMTPCPAPPSAPPAPALQNARERPARSRKAADWPRDAHERDVQLEAAAVADADVREEEVHEDYLEE